MYENLYFIFFFKLRIYDLYKFFKVYIMGFLNVSEYL